MIVRSSGTIRWFGFKLPGYPLFNPQITANQSIIGFVPPLHARVCFAAVTGILNQLFEFAIQFCTRQVRLNRDVASQNPQRYPGLFNFSDKLLILVRPAIHPSAGSDCRESPISPLLPEGKPLTGPVTRHREKTRSSTLRIVRLLSSRLSTSRFGLKISN